MEENILHKRQGNKSSRIENIVDTFFYVLINKYTSARVESLAVAQASKRQRSSL